MKTNIFLSCKLKRIVACLCKEKLSIKVVAVLLTLILIFSMCPISAYASNASKASDSKVSINQSQLNNTNNDKNNQLTSYLPKIDNWFIDALFQDFGLWEGVPSSVRWYSRNFLANMLVDVLYPETSQDDSPEIQMLEEIRKKQKTILDEIQNLSQQFKTKEFIDILEKFKDERGFVFVEDTCKTLKTISDDYKDQLDGSKPWDSDEQQNELADRRKSALTYGLGITNMKDGYSQLEQAYDDMTNLLIDKEYRISDGREGKLYEIKKWDMQQQTIWEHEAWEALENYYSCTMTTYMTLSLIQVASINARIDYITEEKKKNNEDVSAAIDYFTTRLNKVKDNMKAAKDVYSRNNVCKNTSYRHFWAFGKDLYFKSSISKHSIPVESGLDSKGCRIFKSEDSFDESDLFQGTYGKDDIGIKAGKWNSIQPGSSGERAIKTDTLDFMLNTLGNNKTISEIMSRGNFNGMDGDYSPNNTSGKNPILLFDSKDEKNGFYVEKKVHGDGGDWYNDYMPHPKGVELNTKSIEKNANVKDIETYRYYIHNSFDIGIFSCGVCDIKNPSNVYYSLEPIDLGPSDKDSQLVTATIVPENGLIDGSIFPDVKNILVQKGSTYRSMGNRLVFYDKDGNIFAKQTALSTNKRVFKGWTVYDMENSGNYGEISGTITANTKFTAQYDEGRQANVCTEGCTFITNDENIDFSCTGISLVGATDMQYKIDGNNLGLRWKVNGGDYIENTFKPQLPSENHSVSWVISGLKKIDKSPDWHDIEDGDNSENKPIYDETLKIIGNCTAPKDVRVKLNFHSSDLNFGAFLNDKNEVVDSYSLIFDAQDGIVDVKVEDDISDFEGQKMIIKWTDPETGNNCRHTVKAVRLFTHTMLKWWVDQEHDVWLDTGSTGTYKHRYNFFSKDPITVNFTTEY